MSLDWPEKPIVLYGPGADSGTFDTFNQAINGSKRDSRSDYVSSENDNVLVQGVASNSNALGYFGYAYYAANRNKLRALPVESDQGPVMPSLETVQNGSYSPLSRPVFIYVNAKSLKDSASLMALVQYYLNNATQLVQKEDQSFDQGPVSCRQEQDAQASSRNCFWWENPRRFDD